MITVHDDKPINQITKEDTMFRKNKVIHLTLLLFIILSAFLMTVGTFIMLQTSGSMENIFSIAKPPHFLQMHTGDLDQEKIKQFADNTDYVSESEIVEMVNVDGANIWYQKEGSKAVSMAENMLDNGFVKQTKHFDYLLDLDNQIVELRDGEIGVPINYMQKYDLAIGDTIAITKGDFSKTYRISSFLRDAQMASSMASSVRFLLSEHDFMELKEKVGELEYLIEFRLTDSGLSGDFQKDYEDSGMPANGQGITYPLIKLVNMLASGLLAGAMMLVSVVLILIAACNLRFTVLAVLEEEIREIGAMKAIGICNKEIQEMYLKKYRILATIGCMIGFVIGIITNRLFTKNIRLMFGEQSFGIKEFLILILSVLFVYWFILHLCKKILKQINKITVIQALVNGETGTRRKKNDKCFFSLEKYCKNHMNLYLSIRNLVQKAKSWLLIVVVFFLAVNVMLVPMNLIHTFQDKKFANNMGNADCDLWIELHTKNHIEENCMQLVEQLENDKQIKNYSVFYTNKYETIINNETEKVQIQWGNYSDFPIKCIKGNSPKKEGEIALSYLNHKKLDKNVGDFIEITNGKQLRKYKISGIYQDLTSGGYTAKAYCDFQADLVQSYTIYVTCKEGSDKKAICDLYQRQFPFAKILPMEEYMSQTFGSVIHTFDHAAYLSVLVAIFIGVLIMILFLKLQSAKEYSEIATLRVLGFSLKDITKQYLLKGGIAAVIGIFFGILWCNTGCNKLISFILTITNSGIADFKFVVNPVYNFVICPLVLLVVALIMTYLCAREVKQYDVMKMILE